MKRVALLFTGLLFTTMVVSAQKFDDWWNHNFGKLDSKVQSDLQLSPEQRAKINAIKNKAHEKAKKFGANVNQDGHKAKTSFDKLRLETDKDIQGVLNKRQLDVYKNMQKNVKQE